MNFEKNSNEEVLEENKGKDPEHGRTEEKLEENKEEEIKDDFETSEESKKLVEEDIKKTDGLLKKLRAFISGKKEPLLPSRKIDISKEIRDLPSQRGSEMWHVEQKLGRKLNPGEHNNFIRNKEEFYMWLKQQETEKDPSKIDSRLRLDPNFYEKEK
ncbi:hypothetical protein ISS06_00895 [Patescibacteria group bacterium]|nr:hypothetical protein [Patescibacteria group bacterium]